MKSNPIRLAAILALVLGTGLLEAQEPDRKAQAPDPFAVADPPDNPSTGAKIALGKELFESPLLSRNRMISCATCHDPATSFADGLAQSKGIFEVEVGRNSPTLVTVAHMPGFQGPPPAPRPPGRTPRAGDLDAKPLTLEGRCLAPIENPIEMGSTVGEAVAALKASPGMKDSFDRAFGQRGTGVTADRLGKALGAYLRSLRPPDSPYRKFLAGEQAALKDEELRGLTIFNGPGRCASCHAGPGLTDGMFHDVMTPASYRAQRQREGRTRIAADLGEFKSKQPPAPPRDTSGGTSTLKPPGPPPIDKALASLTPGGGVGYYPVQSPTGNQTPTLWDIGRTTPYFRDGSVEDLETVVRQHVAEMRELAPAGPRNPQFPGPLAFAIPTPLTVHGRTDIPKLLKPAATAKDGEPLPDRLNEQQIADLLAFLRALSPRA